MTFKIQDGHFVHADGSEAVLAVFSREERSEAEEFWGVPDEKIDAVSKSTELKVDGDKKYLSLNVPSDDGKEMRVNRVNACWTAGRTLIISDGTDFILRAMDSVEGVTENTAVPSVLTEIVKGDFVYLEGLEKKLAELEGKLIEEEKLNCSKDIIRYRRKFMVMKRYYEQFLDAVSEIGELCSGEEKASYDKLANNLEKLSEDVLNLRDFVSQVREAYQAQIDISLNSVMKFLTVVTSIFMPLSFIAGWFGMNLKMPEVELDWGYFIPIGLTLFTAIASILWFRKRKWF